MDFYDSSSIPFNISDKGIFKALEILSRLYIDIFLFPLSIRLIYVLSKSHFSANFSWDNPFNSLYSLIVFPNFSKNLDFSIGIYTKIM